MKNAIEFNPYSKACPSREVLGEVGNLWSVLIIVSLSDGPLRFGQLQSRIEGISNRMLTQTLRNLERDGLILRTQLPEVPPRVEYSLTDLGTHMLKPLSQVEKWVLQYMPQIMENREKYDAIVAE
ncbi:winged helix-turn-helix transcriptional regulator [Alloscardovia venturai]|uniref:Winged helix-turn-helix transcriptional regulator n=1 Tax=Alloscardovia venturai TaxID=1769421 RepID=A0ABW2Y719_9BIFI